MTDERTGNWSRATATQRIDRIQKSMEVIYEANRKSNDERITIDQGIAIAQVEATLAGAEATLELLDVLERMDV